MEMTDEQSKEPNLKPFDKKDNTGQIGSGNAKFKKGTMDDAYKKANSTEEGKKALPTVPKSE